RSVCVVQSVSEELHAAGLVRCDMWSFLRVAGVTGRNTDADLGLAELRRGEPRLAGVGMDLRRPCGRARVRRRMRRTDLLERPRALHERRERLDDLPYGRCRGGEDVGQLVTRPRP